MTYYIYYTQLIKILVQVCFIFWIDKIILCLLGEYIKITIKNISEKNEGTSVYHTLNCTISMQSFKMFNTDRITIK